MYALPAARDVDSKHINYSLLYQFLEEAAVQNSIPREVRLIEDAGLPYIRCCLPDWSVGPASELSLLSRRAKPLFHLIVIDQSGLLDH